MFTSQTSSFQDSIDVEERDDFDSEEIAGYNQKSQLNCYYTIYLYQGTSLTLIDSSLPSEAEPELRTYISRRLSKGALLGGMGNIATVELRQSFNIFPITTFWNQYFFYPETKESSWFTQICSTCAPSSIPEESVGCYCCLLEQERSPEQPDADGNGYVICFMGGSEKGLNLFRIELDKYVQGLHCSLQTPELQNLETEVRPYLSRWFDESVMHIYRVVQLVQSNISFLLHAALSQTHVEVINSEERTKADVSRFIKAASLQGLSQQDPTAASLCKAISEDTQSNLVIDCSVSPPMLTHTVSNRFCDDWIQAFLNAAERCNPFLLRQILENFKLKAIQDMNSLKRFVRQAEMSHYALFRCCQFLQGCGNGDVLLQNARAEHSDLPEACSIIAVLEEFIKEQSQAQA
uniref:protein Njmu-R1 isoform X2 n=1 Tax=Solea senegalensis TaxID=28829 RepID=UPI001CD8F630|nr:protein Njmu-R1 isoform X2 [Solea senegalensis]